MCCHLCRLVSIFVYRRRSNYHRGSKRARRADVVRRGRGFFNVRVRPNTQVGIKLTRLQKLSIFRPTCHLRLSPSYAIFSSMISFYVPAIIMVLLYTKLYLYARQHVRSIRAQLKQATSLLIMQLASQHIRHVVVSVVFWPPPLVGYGLKRSLKKKRVTNLF